MKKFMIYLSILMISNIYAQCNDYSASQCNNDTSCEWIENIESVTCASLVLDEELCEAAPECTYSCDDGGGYFGWCNSSCYGGMTYIDNGYCQEIEILECSDMNLQQCISEDVCEWVENIDIENCYDILDCTGGCTWQDCEAIEGCNWHFGTAYYDPSYCYGEHEADNSYCEEIEYQLGDINQDSMINIQDVIMVINLILHGEFNFTAVLNLDFTVNVLDVIQMVNIILNSDILPENCYIVPETGPCFGICPTYFYNQSSYQCEEFITGCCGVEAFNTLQNCQNTCE